MKNFHYIFILLEVFLYSFQGTAQQLPSKVDSKNRALNVCNTKDISFHIDAEKNSDFTGRGNKDEILIKLKISVGKQSPITVNSFKINLTGTNSSSDLSSVKIYSTDSTDTFDSRKTKNYTLLGNYHPIADELICQVNGNTLKTGNHYVWITADIADNAIEGNKVGAALVSATYNMDKEFLLPPQTINEREILLAHKLLFAPGDYGSKNYRIPAIITADDGSLIAICDKRKFNETDLPEDIDLISIRSTDNGKTWSEPITIAQGTGRNQGFGDGAMVKTASGKILAIFVGGPGLWNSTPTNPIRTYIRESDNNGITWTAPRDITPQLFGDDCPDTSRRKWLASFCAAGRGIQTRNGRILLVAAVRETSDYLLNNYVYYSDDEGITWHVSEKAMTGGDESKVVELNNGNILMSIRNKNKGKRLYTLSTNNGVSWTPYQEWTEINDPACNGEILRYTSVPDGYEKNRLLHSIPDDKENRKNVSVFLSYNEGETWEIKKSICPTASAYSSLTILPDGTIGIFFEKESSNMSLYFANFSLDWLTNNSDTYQTPNQK